MPTLDTYHGVYLWHYIPSLPLSITFAVLFGLATVAHGWRMVATRMWFCLPFVIGGLFEEIGYISRAAAYNATGSLTPYILQALFLLLPPVLFAASQYMVYSRLVRAVDGARFSLVAPRWTTVVFVTGDFFCLNIQSTGGGLQVKPKNAAVGGWIVVAGLGLQVLMSACFVLCCLVFNLRYRAHLRANPGQRTDVPWQSCLNMLYATSAAVLVRNIYRVVEFVMGQEAYLIVHEWPTYVFDAALMLLVMIAFFVWYPSQLKPREEGGSMMQLTSDVASAAEHGRAVKYTGPPL